ncbi:hypothetical protein [Deinococcus kurensis]|uniref:hypothetical protein n=1 Tax=Deinococcus kurensis TaxID=2662757 RepID=UPI0012D2CF7E|nr:hypothetical protein [Deinococcus kurensis]
MNSTTVPRSRPLPLAALTLAALTLATLLGACSLGRDDRSAEATQAAANATLRDAMTASARAVQGTSLKADARWFTCPGGIGSRYSGGGVMASPPGDRTAQLAAIRGAVLAAGFQDATQVDGHVTAQRDDVSVDIRFRVPDGSWTFSVLTRCHTYGRQDRARVKSGDRHVILP